MDINIPSSETPIGGRREAPQLSRAQKARNKFFNLLPNLFGFRKTADAKARRPIDFVKVDLDSEMRVAQAKMPKIFKTKANKTLDELFNAWITDVYDTYQDYVEREKRLAELEFAIMNDPFLGKAVELYADEASQIDSQDNLIAIDCADIRMKQKMEDLLDQWGVTQNRVRGALRNLAWSGDAFWATKITPRGVIRINPLDVHQVTERLEFDPIQVASKLALNHDMISALNKDSKLQMMLDTLDSDENGEFADMFDKKLFGFTVNGDMVVPPWNIVHFRLDSDQSEFYPMGKSLFLKALAPFRQAAATMTLQNIARVHSFPVSLFEVNVPPGVDEQQTYALVEEAREQYENLGETGNNSETMSINTKMWLPKDHIDLKMISPNIDINAIGDLQLYLDRVAVASGIPKGYLAQEWGGFGNSAISLIEQYKPFARSAFSLQSAFLEGLSNLYRLHFAITGEFDYREPFVLSMKFPNEETSEAKRQARGDSLELSKSVLDTVASVVGAIDEPLPQEVIQDILTKFSFLDPKDIKRWIKPNPNAAETGKGADDTGLDGGDLGGGASFGAGGGGDLGSTGDELDLGGGGAGEEGLDIGGAEGEVGQEGEGLDLGGEVPPETEEPKKPETKIEQQRRLASMKQLREKVRLQELLKRYKEVKGTVYKEVLKKWVRMDEGTMNNRHFKYTPIHSSLELMLDTLTKTRKGVDSSEKRPLKEVIHSFMEKCSGSLTAETKASWKVMKEEMQKAEDESENTIAEENDE